MEMAKTITRLFGHTMEVKEEEYDEWVAEALTELGQRPLTPLPTTPLLGFPSELITANDARVKKAGLDATISESLDRLKWRGEDSAGLRERFRGFPELPTLIDLKTKGTNYFQFDGWRPNGGRDSGSGLSTKAIEMSAITLWSSWPCKGRS